MQIAGAPAIIRGILTSNPDVAMHPKALSAAEYGKLVGVTQQSIYNWESGKTRPRAQQIPLLVSLRALGIREARARLDQAGKNGPKKRAVAKR